MKVILSGGGTGGHIYPALSIADEILKQDKEAEILYIGKENSLEEELVTRKGLNFKTVRVSPLPRKSINLSSLKSLKNLMQGISDSFKILKEFKPDVIIGTGGYVCAPILLAGQMKGYPTIVQEQNAFPGKTNRLLGKKAKLIALSFPEAEKYFPEHVEKIMAGNPVREIFTTMTTEEAVQKVSSEIEIGKLPYILSFGGSGGQESTNDAILAMMKEHPSPDFILFHITGKAHYDEFMAKVPEGIDKNKYIIKNYLYDIPAFIKASDLVITSSSAMALAEISASGHPSILIPKAYTAGNHQYHNALSYQNAGAALMIEEEELTGEKLYSEIENLIKDQEKLNAMSEATKALSHGNAAEIIVSNLERICK